MNGFSARRLLTLAGINVLIHNLSLTQAQLGDQSLYFWASISLTAKWWVNVLEFSRWEEPGGCVRVLASLPAPSHLKAANMAESRETGMSALLFMVGLLSPGIGLLGIHHYLRSRLLPLKVCVR